ncbi:MAG: cytochrome b/b6 domain-containing protein, partial [Synechococcales cyanobacterium RU_4_20]|nr:cytochrome b/b6 domain-containing protein [Synechococcales cyanobacterium RU_4_20]
LVLYAFHRGQRRLLQPDSLTKLTQLDQPIGWYSWGRLANSLTLIALTLAVFSGKMMDDTWLPKGELDHLWYSIHLIAWVGMGVAIALHLALNAKVGGNPLLQSIWQTKFRAKDSPQLWPSQISAWWSQVRALSWPERLTALAARPKLELAIWLSLGAAWGISLAQELMFSR